MQLNLNIMFLAILYEHVLSNKMVRCETYNSQTIFLSYCKGLFQLSGRFSGGFLPEGNVYRTEKVLPFVQRLIICNPCQRKPLYNMMGFILCRKQSVRCFQPLKGLHIVLEFFVGHINRKITQKIVQEMLSCIFKGFQFVFLKCFTILICRLVESLAIFQTSKLDVSLYD